jgi:dihydrofolate synthase/folylpolyglutamate synthase
MSAALPPAVQELLAWAAVEDRSPAAKRQRVPALLAESAEWWARTPSVKVAGTNGKGSTCALLAAGLQRAGRRVGLFTSPHLVHVTERVRVGARDVPTAQLEQHVARAHERARALVRSHGDALRASFFEVLLAAALTLFAEEQVDVAVIEAGIGGRHDATSLLPSQLGALTSVGYDHQDVLGPTLADIARDKAGIVGPGAHLVLGPEIGDDIAEVVAQAAPGVTLERAQLAGLTLRHEDLHGSLVACAPEPGAPPIEVHLPLAGRHQLANCATAQALLRRLAALTRLDVARALPGFAEARWPGRLDLRPGPPRLLFDAAHNAHGLAALTRALADLVPFERRQIAFGLSSGKDLRACLALLPGLAPRVHFVQGFHRARDTRELRAHLPAGIECVGEHASPAALWSLLQAGVDADTTLVTGSIFLLGELLARCEVPR